MGKTASGAKKGRDGSGLIFTLFFILISGVITGALLNAGVTHRKVAQRSYNRERAMNVAEAGLETIAQTIANVNGYLASTYSATGSVDGYAWKASSTKLSEFVFQVDSTGVVDGVQWCIHASRVELPSWSQYALWMDQNNGIQFVAGESFYGWVHSNAQLVFTPSGGVGPYFYDKLTTAVTNYSGSTNGSYFAKGFELGADQSSMANVDFSALLTNAQLYGGTILTGLTTVTFSGTIAKVTNARRGWTNFSLTMGNTNIMYVKNATSGSNSNGDVYVGGKLDGRLTIAVEKGIYITNHITYQSNPTNNPSSDDALGLISKDDIQVTTNAPDNIWIFAAMLATGQNADTNDVGQFKVTNHNVGALRGALNVWGSIVQESRGAVGTASSGIMTHGYYKNYTYDTRFRNAAPPYYPRVATKVDFSGWREGPS